MLRIFLTFVFFAKGRCLQLPAAGDVAHGAQAAPHNPRRRLHKGRRRWCPRLQSGQCRLLTASEAGLNGVRDIEVGVRFFDRLPRVGRCRRWTCMRRLRGRFLDGALRQQLDGDYCRLSRQHDEPCVCIPRALNQLDLPQKRADCGGLLCASLRAVLWDLRLLGHAPAGKPHM